MVNEYPHGGSMVLLSVIVIIGKFIVVFADGGNGACDKLFKCTCIACGVFQRLRCNKMRYRSGACKSKKSDGKQEDAYDEGRNRGGRGRQKE